MDSFDLKQQSKKSLKLTVWWILIAIFGIAFVILLLVYLVLDPTPVTNKYKNINIDSGIENKYLKNFKLAEGKFQSIENDLKSHKYDVNINEDIKDIKGLLRTTEKRLIEMKKEYVPQINSLKGEVSSTKDSITRQIGDLKNSIKTGKDNAERWKKETIEDTENAKKYSTEYDDYKKSSEEKIKNLETEIDDKKKKLYQFHLDLLTNLNKKFEELNKTYKEKETDMKKKLKELKVNLSKSPKYTIPLQDGRQYEGECVNGMPHGLGMLSSVDGTKISGQFYNGVVSGIATIRFKDDTTYEGELFNGFYNGYGILTMVDDSTFEGDFVNGNMIGLGVFRFDNGFTFIGEVKDYHPHGFGKMYKEDGEYYIGDFTSGNFNKGFYYDSKTKSITEVTEPQVAGEVPKGKVYNPDGSIVN